jgi:hypothetical protein
MVHGWRSAIMLVGACVGGLAVTGLTAWIAPMDFVARAKSLTAPVLLLRSATTG